MTGKRWMAFVLLVLAALWVLPGACAQEPASYGSVGMAGGQVFALQRGELLRYDTAGGDFVPAGLSPVPGNMLADSLEGLYLFSCQEQTLTQLETAAPYGAMATWKVDPLPFTADEIYRAAVAEGVLYLLTAQETAFPFRGVWAYELATGQQEDCPVPATADMTCGEGGQLLLYSAPLGQEGGLYAWRMGSGPQKLCAAPATQAYTPGGLAYDPAGQVCYMQANGVILALEGGSLRETAYAPDYENGDFRSGAVTPEGCYLRFYSDGSLWPLSLGQPQQEVLRIAGVFPDASLLDAYRQAYPQVAVAVSPELPSQEDAFAQALVNRTLEADIIITSTASELYGPLLEKGYVLPLDGDSRCAGAVDSMYPAIQDQVTRDGQRLALPLGLSMETMWYNQRLFTELGLSVPTTVEELLRCCAEASLPPEVGMLRDALVPLSDALLQQTMDLALLQGEGADLDVARALLTLWAQNASAYANADRVADQALFARMTSVQLGEALWDMEDYRPLVLSVAPEQSPALPASMPVMMIYAGTRQPERCLEFLAFCAENLDAAAWVALSPQRGEPVEKAGLEEELAALETQLSALDTQLAAQPEVEALQLEREELQLRLQALRDDPWQVSPQAIASYQAMAPNLVFYLQRWRYDTTDAQVYQLRERMRTHQISAEQFVKDYQHMLWMFNRENGDEAHG